MRRMATTMATSTATIAKASAIQAQLGSALGVGGGVGEDPGFPGTSHPKSRYVYVDPRWVAVASMFHTVMVPRRDFATLMCRAFCNAGFGPVELIVLFPLMSTGTKPVAFDVSQVAPFTYVTMKWLALSARVYRRISYEVLSRFAMSPCTSRVKLTFAEAFADRIHRRFTLSGNGLIVRSPVEVGTGVMFEVQSFTTSLAGSL